MELGMGEDVWVIMAYHSQSKPHWFRTVCHSIFLIVLNASLESFIFFSVDILVRAGGFVIVPVPLPSLIYTLDTGGENKFEATCATTIATTTMMLINTKSFILEPLPLFRGLEFGNETFYFNYGINLKSLWH